MKRLIFSLLAICTPLFLHAQEGSGLGFNFGANISNVIFDGDDALNIDNGIKGGFSTSLYYDIAFNKSFYFQPGLAFAMRGMKNSSDDIKISTGYLQIPTLLSYRIFLTDKHVLGFNVGPTFGYALYGNAKIDGEKYKVFGSDFKDLGLECNRFEVGIHAAVSYYIIGHVISLSWERGLTNTYAGDGDLSIKNSTVAITFGYRY